MKASVFNPEYAGLPKHPYLRPRHCKQGAGVVRELIIILKQPAIAIGESREFRKM